jgi:hypothetical protein
MPKTSFGGFRENVAPGVRGFSLDAIKDLHTLLTGLSGPILEGQLLSAATTGQRNALDVEAALGSSGVNNTGIGAIARAGTRGGVTLGISNAIAALQQQILQLANQGGLQIGAQTTDLFKGIRQAELGVEASKGQRDPIAGLASLVGAGAQVAAAL